MSTFRRRDMKRRPLSKSARALLRSIEQGPQPPGYAREIVAASGIRQDWAWSAMDQLLERGLVERRPWGHMRLTAAGRDVLKSAA